MEEKQEQKECHKWLMQICPICGKNLPVTKLIMCIWNELGANVCIIAATAVLS